MDNYVDLVTRILKNGCLAKAVQEMSGLNLVCTDWLTRLENNIEYQNMRFKPAITKAASTSAYIWEESKNTLLDVTVAGIGRFLKPSENSKVVRSFVSISNCEPLIKIARAVTNDLGEDIHISDECKFSFDDCNIMSCEDCRSSYEIFEQRGHKISKGNQPCICVTKVFDGKRIVNRFKSQMEKIFQQPFMVILTLKIKSRYSYTDSNHTKTYRICGVITDIIGFHEAKLELIKSINLGDIASIEEPKESDELEENGIVIAQSETNSEKVRKRKADKEENPGNSKMFKKEEDSATTKIVEDFFYMN